MKVKETWVRNIVSFLFLSSHLGVVIWVAYLTFFSRDLDKESWDIVWTTVTPVFGALFVLIIKYTIENKKNFIKLREEEDQVNSNFAFWAIAIPVSYIVSVVFIIYYHAMIQRSEYFVLLLGTTETIFAGVVGFFVNDLFPLKDPNRIFGIDWNKHSLEQSKPPKVSGESTGGDSKPKKTPPNDKP